MSKCIKCGNVLEDDNVYDYTSIGFEEIKGHCFTCNFWSNQVKLHKEEPNKRFIINGTSYSVGPEDAGRMRGFGGCPFSIKLKDSGKVVETTNMWCQGEVSEHFRSELPDTADFVPYEKDECFPLSNDIPF